MASVPRPIIISVVSVISIIFSLLSFTTLFMPSTRHLGDFVPMLLGILITFQFVSVIGTWHMKRWGVHVFIIVFFARILTSIYLQTTGIGFYFYIFYSLVFIIIFLIYYRRMDINL